jgi:hypothetical protein
MQSTFKVQGTLQETFQQQMFLSSYSPMCSQGKALLNFLLWAKWYGDHELSADLHGDGKEEWTREISQTALLRAKKWIKKEHGI